MNIEESHLELYSIFEMTLKDLDMHNKDAALARRIENIYILLLHGKARFKEHINRE